MPYQMNEGQEKRSGQPAMNRSKQGGMGIKTIVVLLVGLALVSVHFAQAQQKAKVPKIGWLVPRLNYRFEDFLREFRKLGYVDGKNYLSRRDLLVVILTGSLLWPKTWSDSKSMLSSRAGRRDSSSQEGYQDDPDRLL